MSALAKTTICVTIGRNAPTACGKRDGLDFYAFNSDPVTRPIPLGTIWARAFSDEARAQLADFRPGERIALTGAFEKIDLGAGWAAFAIESAARAREEVRGNE